MRLLKIPTWRSFSSSADHLVSSGLSPVDGGGVILEQATPTRINIPFLAQHCRLARYSWFLPHTNPNPLRFRHCSVIITSLSRLFLQSDHTLPTLTFWVTWTTVALLFLLTYHTRIMLSVPQGQPYLLINPNAAFSGFTVERLDNYVNSIVSSWPQFEVSFCRSAQYFTERTQSMVY